VAALILVVLDRSRPMSEEDARIFDETSHSRRIVVANKSDRAAAWHAEMLAPTPVLAVSATEGHGLAQLRAAIAEALTGHEPARDVPAITNVRHVDLLTRARAALVRAESAARSGTPEEFVLADINEARMHFEEITGVRTTDDVLAAIFSKFCIGK
jgi:tRNA modification GTPase